MPGDPMAILLQRIAQGLYDQRIIIDDKNA
jgi:hypothetical protein